MILYFVSSPAKVTAITTSSRSRRRASFSVYWCFTSYASHLTFFDLFPLMSNSKTYFGAGIGGSTGRGAVGDFGIASGDDVYDGDVTVSNEGDRGVDATFGTAFATTLGLAISEYFAVGFNNFICGDESDERTAAGRFRVGAIGTVAFGTVLIREGTGR